MKRTMLVILVILIGHASQTLAFDLGTARSDGLGGGICLSEPTPAEMLQLPASKADSSTAFQSWYRRQYEMKEFDQAYLAATIHRPAWTFAAGLGQFGHSDLYRELTARLGLAYHLKSWSLSVCWSGMMVDFGSGYDRLRGATMDLAAVWRSAPLYFALRGERLTSPRLDNNSPRLRPRYSVYAEWRGPGGYRFVGRATVEPEQKPQCGLGQIIDISHRAEFFWGVSTQPTQYGGGVRLGLGRQLLTYAAAYHPSLGLTHSVGVSINFAPRHTAP